ncbi:MAG TPA: hypothetical protein ENN68_08875 [Methanomicrobia archaeon]|nr:hypothetical protein [Methanomicrobia archaeon]
MKNYQQKLEEAKTLADVFEIVKDGVRKVLHTGRAGLTLGLADLGSDASTWVGAFYPIGSNTIVMNRTPLQWITRMHPQLFTAYAFHVLLHEYIHALGYPEEVHTRKIVFWISRELFGEEHVVTQMSRDMSAFIPPVAYSTEEPIQENLEGVELEMVPDFDRSSVTYIR